MDKYEEIDEKYKLNGDVLNTLNAWDEMISQFDVNEKISPTIMINDAYKKYNEEEFNNFPTWKKDYMTKNKPLIEKYSHQFKSWYLKEFHEISYLMSLLLN